MREVDRAIFFAFRLRSGLTRRTKREKSPASADVAPGATSPGLFHACSLVGIIQIYQTARLPEGDGTGMQWVILTPLAILFLFIVVPSFMTGVRGLRSLHATEPVEPLRVIPGRGWLIALTLLALYILAAFVVAPLLDLLMGD